MNKATTTTIMMRLRWGAFFLVLLFLVIQVIPRALGQRDASKRSSDVEIPLLKQQAPISTISTFRASRVFVVDAHG